VVQLEKSEDKLLCHLGSGGVFSVNSLIVLLVRMLVRDRDGSRGEVEERVFKKL